MNPYYKQPIVVFGLAAPLLLIAVAFGGILHFKDKFEKTYEERLSNYTQYRKNEQVREGLESVVMGQKSTLGTWMKLFETPTASRVNSLLGEVQKRFSGDEFQQTSFQRLTSTGGIGGASTQQSVQLQLKFRGTYRGLQNAFLELETQMPQLQLDMLKLKQETDRNLLSAELNYTAWEKE